ncbi:MAG: phenylalanine--tRNA ligase subunit beta [Streptosporangiaceae bacterium]|nr:phenylalanine--tRNA ligase subunit beta [Pseudonocardiales bacterium]MBV9446862.1 phenylalanine--tRNA ligase subunit beta [Streptosporangiaceae bacterium]
MKISLEWVRDFVDLPRDLNVADVARELTLRTVEVEDHVDLAGSLLGIVVGRVLTLEPVGDRGHLAATCDVGVGEPVAVVTRAASVAVGGTVAVALPGARLAVPGQAETTAEVVPTKVAGMPSGGVICTAADLRLQRLYPGSPSGGALDLAETDAVVGTPVADALRWNDHVLEIDNKSLTNRPDLWGHYGIARELATIYGLELKPLSAAKRPPRVDGLVGDLDPALCRRLAVVIFSIAGKETAPLWLRSRLARIGEGSVNLCVDLSNYVMFTVGQPTHVYDADRITFPLSVSTCGSTTKIDLLNGESREVEPPTPVIRDDEAPVALAGIMGGSASAVTQGSMRFALEVATFRPEVIRRSSQRLATRTEASARFEKGLDTQRADAALDLFLNVLAQIAPHAIVAGMQDVDLDPTPPTQVELDLAFLTSRIGQTLEVAEIRRILTSLGFEVAGTDGHLTITAPTWRSTGDVSLPHDIVEEVARIHGYDNISTAPLSVALTPARQLNHKPLDRIVREQLAMRAGMQEIVTYPWAADSMLLAAGHDKGKTIRFEGAPAPDRNSLRPSLVPNLLEAVASNLRYAQSFDLFEVGVTFADSTLVAYHNIFEPLPPLSHMAAGAFVGADGPALFQRAKGVLEMLRRHAHLTNLRFTDASTAPWADRSARLAVIGNGRQIGTLGLLTQRCRRLAGIDTVQVSCFEVGLDGLSVHKSRENRYEPVPELPDAEFDLSFLVADNIRWTTIHATVAGANGLIHRVTFVDEFRGAWVPEQHRSVTLRVTLRPKDATLTADMIAAARSEAIVVLERELGARLRE